MSPEKKKLKRRRGRGRPASSRRNLFRERMENTTDHALTYAGMARELGVSAVTVKRWAEELEVLHRFRKRQAKPEAAPSSGTPTVRELAEQTGFSTATVSLALRHSPEVKPETGEIIRQTARKLGYQAHPYVRAHMAAIRKGRPPKVREVLAYLCYDLESPGGDPYPGKTGRRLRAAERRAHELGFMVKPYNLRSAHWTPSHLRGVLESTGVRGLLVELPAYKSRHLSFQFSNFKVVGFREVPGYSFPLILNDAYRNQLIAFARLWERGYRRIARVHFYHRSMESLYEGNAAYHLAQSMLCPPEDRIPVLQFETLTDLLEQYVQQGKWKESPHLLPGYDWLKAQTWRLSAGKPISYYRDAFMDAWHAEFQPEVYISLDGRVRYSLEANGLRVPEDVGLVHLDVGEETYPWSGMRAREDVQTRLAVDRLVDLLNRSASTPEENEWNIRVPGDWWNGKTTRLLTPSRPMTPQEHSFLRLLLDQRQVPASQEI